MRLLVALSLPRRLLTISAVFVTLFVVVTTVPLWAFAAIVVSPWLPGRWRPLRLFCFLLLWLVLEAGALLWLAWLWVAFGAGRRLDTPEAAAAHHRLLGLVLGRLARGAQRLFHVRIAMDAPAPARQAVRKPVLVLSRHAGPGDSFLLVHELVAVYDRRPRIVLRDTLRFDPAIDVLLGRLPTRFINPSPQAGFRVTEKIARLAEDMGSDDALLIFPEGGNFTERRRQRSIAKLEASGRAAHAAVARRMRHLVAPRPGGVLAALDAAPGADVVFVAHTGLEQLSSVFDLWRGLPMDSEVLARYWLVAAEDIPADRDARIMWLFDWWSRIDDWIASHAPHDTEVSGQESD